MKMRDVRRDELMHDELRRDELRRDELGLAIRRDELRRCDDGEFVYCIPKMEKNPLFAKANAI